MEPRAGSGETQKTVFKKNIESCDYRDDCKFGVTWTNRCGYMRTCSSLTTSCWYQDLERFGANRIFFIPWSYPNISSTPHDMRQSATLGHSQNRAPCMETLSFESTIDLWNLFQGRVCCVIIKWTRKRQYGGVTKNLNTGSSSTWRMWHVTVVTVQTQLANGLPCWMVRWLMFRYWDARRLRISLLVPYSKSDSTWLRHPERVFVLLGLTWIHCSSS